MYASDIEKADELHMSTYDSPNVPTFAPLIDHGYADGPRLTAEQIDTRWHNITHTALTYVTSLLNIDGETTKSAHWYNHVLESSRNAHRLCVMCRYIHDDSRFITEDDLRTGHYDICVTCLRKL